MTLTSGSVWSVASHGYIMGGAAINPADGPTVYTYANEQDDARVASRITTRWGKGSQFMRVVHSPKLKWDDLIASGELYSLGTIIPSGWLDHSTGSGAAAARLQRVERREQPRGGGDRVVLTYIEFDAGTESDGYAETSIARRPREGEARDSFIVHGVALTRTSTGIPAVEDVLDGSAYDAISDQICYDVQIDETSQHGRVVVTSLWANRLAGSFSQRV